MSETKCEREDEKNEIEKTQMMMSFFNLEKIAKPFCVFYFMHAPSLFNRNC